MVVRASQLDFRPPADGPRPPLRFNWVALIRQTHLDHDRGEIIWNERTRLELRESIIREVSLFVEDKVYLGGWIYIFFLSQFIVAVFSSSFLFPKIQLSLPLFLSFMSSDPLYVIHVCSYLSFVIFVWDFRFFFLNSANSRRLLLSGTTKNFLSHMRAFADIWVSVDFISPTI